MADPLDEHYGYLSDRLKVDRYRAAIERAVRPGHVVMDLGCGSGLLGLMALRAGAEKVLFVEEGAIIEVAQRTVVEAGFGDRAEFLHVNSFELEPPEVVDVVLCDHVGYFGFDYNVLALLADAKQRFLKPGGVIIPAEIGLSLAPVETATGREQVARWRDGSVPDEYAWVGTSAANSKLPLDLEGENVLADPASLGTLELGADDDAYLNWSADFDCTRDGTLDGLLGWFDCRLYDDISMTNSPTASDHIDRPQAFLPLEEPVVVRKSETLQATIMARPADHILAWTVTLRDRQFSLTTFNGLLLDGEALERSRPDRVARLNDRGRAYQVVLSYCDGKRTVGEIEALVRAEHPRLFPSARATEQFVRRVLAWSSSE